MTTLKPQATELLPGIKRDKASLLITRHGLPSTYLLAVEAFKPTEQRMAPLERIARGEQAVADGRVACHAQAKKHLARWLK